MRERYKKPDWLIGGRTPDEPGILAGAALVMIYGRAKCLKTFTILDQALCVAAGRDWHGYKVAQGPVVYVVAEDPAYIMDRVDAWGAHNGVDVDSIPFRMIPAPAQLLNSDEIGVLCRTVAALRPVLVVFDTLGRCMVGGEEVSNDDFHRIAGAMDRIRCETGATVVVHHEGHGRGGLPRGASAMLGDMTTVIRVHRPSLTLPAATLTCKDQRVAAHFADIAIRTECVQTPSGATTLVVVKADNATKQQPRGTAPRQVYPKGAIGDFLRALDRTPGQPVVVPLLAKRLKKKENAVHKLAHDARAAGYSLNNVRGAGYVRVLGPEEAVA